LIAQVFFKASVVWPSSSPATTSIIGVPRSGMIPAAAIATHCHLPLYELTAADPRRMDAGSRGFNGKVDAGRPKLLLVDDSSHNGGAMMRARHILREYSVMYAVVYILIGLTIRTNRLSVAIQFLGQGEGNGRATTHALFAMAEDRTHLIQMVLHELPYSFSRAAPNLAEPLGRLGVSPRPGYEPVWTSLPATPPEWGRLLQGLQGNQAGLARAGQK
jgi:hypothetical protein